MLDGWSMLDDVLDRQMGNNVAKCEQAIDLLPADDDIPRVAIYLGEHFPVLAHWRKWSLSPDIRQRHQRGSGLGRLRSFSQEEGDNDELELLHHEHFAPVSERQRAYLGCSS